MTDAGPDAWRVACVLATTCQSRVRCSASSSDATSPTPVPLVLRCSPAPERGTVREPEASNLARPDVHVGNKERPTMRLISVVSIVFALALTFAIAGFSPALTANQTAGRSDDDTERRSRR